MAGQEATTINRRPTLDEISQMIEQMFDHNQKVYKKKIQQERGRAEILRVALDKIWTKPITEELAHEIAGNALAEWEAE